MQSPPLLKGGSQRPMESLFEVERAAPFDDVGKEIAVERRIVSEQLGKVKSALGCHQVLKTDLARRDVRPVPGRHQPVVWIRPVLANPLEDHEVSLGGRGHGLRYAAGSPAPRILAPSV